MPELRRRRPSRSRGGISKSSERGDGRSPKRRTPSPPDTSPSFADARCAAAEWRAFNATKPDEQYENPDDDAAIEVARNTLGDFKLKSALDYDCPGGGLAELPRKRAPRLLRKRRFLIDMVDFRRATRSRRCTARTWGGCQAVCAHRGDYRRTRRRRSSLDDRALRVAERFRSTPFGRVTRRRTTRTTDSSRRGMPRRAEAAAKAAAEAAKAGGGFGGGGGATKKDKTEEPTETDGVEEETDRIAAAVAAAGGGEGHRRASSRDHRRRVRAHATGGVRGGGARASTRTRARAARGDSSRRGASIRRRAQGAFGEGAVVCGGRAQDGGDDEIDVQPGAGAAAAVRERREAAARKARGEDGGARDLDAEMEEIANKVEDKEDELPGVVERRIRC